METLPAAEISGSAVPARGELVLWFGAAALFVLTLVLGFLAYLNPAMMIEFASLRLCG